MSQNEHVLMVLAIVVGLIYPYTMINYSIKGVDGLGFANVMYPTNGLVGEKTDRSRKGDDVAWWFNFVCVM